jgi:ubiquinone biosynthesis protein COQ9
MPTIHSLVANVYPLDRVNSVFFYERNGVLDLFLYRFTIILIPRIMKPQFRTIQDSILKAALPIIPFDGWTERALKQAAKDAGFDPVMVDAVFPAGVDDAIDHYAQMMDGAMEKSLKQDKNPPARIQDKIKQAIAFRLDAMAPNKEVERLACAHWLRPMRKARGAKILWRTADRIWTYAGDTSTDYNFYTKRTLLCGVLSSTFLYWFNDTSPNHGATHAFTDRRIQNILSFGRALSTFKKDRGGKR